MARTKDEKKLFGIYDEVWVILQTINRHAVQQVLGVFLLLSHCIAQMQQSAAYSTLWQLLSHPKREESLCWRRVTARRQPTAQEQNRGGAREAQHA